MADCATCGQKAGLGKKLCAACAAKEQERELQERKAQEELERQKEIERRQAEEVRRKQAEEDRSRRFDEFIKLRMSELNALLDQGVTPYLYETTSISSNSYFHESAKPNAWNFKTSTEMVSSPPDALALKTLGWAGWEIVQAIPITYGSVLYNTVGGNTVYAGAYGGMVVGVNLILRLPLTREFLKTSSSIVEEQLAKEFPG
jgi:hypothetical protein